MKWSLVGSAVAVVTVVGGVAAYGAGSGAPDPGQHAAARGTDQSQDADKDADKGADADQGKGKDTDKGGQHGQGQSAHAQQMVAIAQAHRTGMQKWHSCVSAAAKAGTAKPTKACDKPLPPGWVKHPGNRAGQQPGRHDDKGEKSGD
jgi:hypothetical protein